MKKNIITLIILILLGVGAHAQHKQVIGLDYSFGFNPAGDNFTYADKEIGHYALGWYTVPGSAEARLSGYGGVKFFTGGRLRLAIRRNGNVGINTAVPTSTLQVNGAITSYRTGGNQFSIQSSQNRWDLDVDEGANNSFRLRNMTSGTVPLTVTTSGAVGIGTTTMGSHKLAVEGSIGAREVKVLANGWADFVFENNYELRSLGEVEKYITENKHLPEIPSEAEVMEQGINLGDMDAKLLRKIEELMLYLIEQNKKLEALTEQNSQQEKEIQALKKQL